jgi:CRP/FNR family transcriptional regulator, cyclic AMP receptor protein
MRTEDPFTPLLDLDPDLGRLLPAERIGEARVELGVRITFVARGAWQADRLSDVGSEHLGLLMLDGVIAREVLLADTTSIELVGAGDVLRPWHADDGPSLSRHEIRWTALADAHLAVLDRRFASRLTRFPEVNTTIMERILDRVHRFALTQAISQLNGVDRRLLALFWHLAERWGRMTPSGIVVSLALSHRELGELVGARRPTISSALGALAQRGELTRCSDGSWLLTGEPIGIPSDEARRIIEHRRRLRSRNASGCSQAASATARCASSGQKSAIAWPTSAIAWPTSATVSPTSTTAPAPALSPSPTPTRSACTTADAWSPPLHDGRAVETFSGQLSCHRQLNQGAPHVRHGDSRPPVPDRDSGGVAR